MEILGKIFEKEEQIETIVEEIEKISKPLERLWQERIKSIDPNGYVR